MPERAEEYIARAEMAEKLARRARDSSERETFLEVAQLWRQLAADRFAIVGAPSPPASVEQQQDSRHPL
jgi:hypothetical protein